MRDRKSKPTPADFDSVTIFVVSEAQRVRYGEDTLRKLGGDPEGEVLVNLDE